MLDSRIVKVKVKGDYACFTRPDLKVERMTYPCMTPSAARGILDSILWKPEFFWYVRRIVILAPVQLIAVKRNEINSKQGKKPITVDEVNEKGQPLYRAQRNSVILKNVSYIIEASIYQKTPSAQNKPEKYIGKKGVDADRDGIFTRRLKKGQCWRKPFLGTREFSADFMEVEGTEQPIAETIPIGSMLFDVFYDAKGNPQPLFFQDAVVRDGVLQCPDDLNEKMMQSSHIQPPMDSEMSAFVYEFNRREESEVTV